MPAAAIYWIILIATTAYSYLSRPKPPSVRPNTGDRPVTEEGRKVLEVFGDCVVEDLTMLAYEEIDQLKIKGKGKK